MSPISYWLLLVLLGVAACSSPTLDRVSGTDPIWWSQHVRRNF